MGLAVRSRALGPRSLWLMDQLLRQAFSRELSGSKSGPRTVIVPASPALGSSEVLSALMVDPSVRTVPALVSTSGSPYRAAPAISLR